MNINYKSDFKILENFIGETDLETPFRFTYKSSTSASYVVWFDGEEYSSCRRLDDGSLLVSFNNHSLMPGELTVLREWFLTDSDFEDGVCNSTIIESCGVTLWSGASDSSTTVIEVLPNYHKGESGDSAYQIALNNGFVGTEQEWLESLSVNVVQECGASEDSVMSQEASTRLFLSSDQAIELLAYGVEHSVVLSSYECTRIGSMAMHRTLPVQSLMRGCLLDDNGNVLEYLPDGDWSSYDRSGASGQVMVEIPQHYRYFESEGYIHRVWISLSNIDGFELVPKSYVGAYEAAVDRDEDLLCSIVNPLERYRGGDNLATNDDNDLSLLGRPATGLSLLDFREYARNRSANGLDWNIMSYDQYKTLYWLYTIEYASTNTQSAYNTTLTADGYRQGGLSDGVTSFSASTSDWDNYNGKRPFVPCGVTDSFGNGSGVVLYNALTSSSSYFNTVLVNRYRGIENIFGHIWTLMDGLVIQNTDDGVSYAYTCSDPAYFNDDDTTN